MGNSNRNITYACETGLTQTETGPHHKSSVACNFFKIKKIELLCNRKTCVSV